MNILLLLPLLQEIMQIDDMIEKRTSIYPCPINLREEEEVYSLFEILEDTQNKYKKEIEKFGTPPCLINMESELDSNPKIDLNYLGDIINACNSIKNLCYVDDPTLILIIANDFKQAAINVLKKRLGDN